MNVVDRGVEYHSRLENSCHDESLTKAWYDRTVERESSKYTENFI